MNFDEAIRAHSDWKMKLKRYLANPDRSINASELAKDNVCPLGCWLHGEGKKFQNIDVFPQLLDEHKKFHQEAADIVIRKDKGENVQADIALAGNSPFATHSMNVVSLLMKMKKMV